MGSLLERVRQLQAARAAQLARMRRPIDPIMRAARVANLFARNPQDRRGARVAELMNLALGRKHAAEFSDLA